jgi:hypothetical protein
VGWGRGVRENVRSAYIVVSGGQSKPAKRLSDHRVYRTVQLDIKESVPPVVAVLLHAYIHEFYVLLIALK